jgi:hypothetical protein
VRLDKRPIGTPRSRKHVVGCAEWLRRALSGHLLQQLRTWPRHEPHCEGRSSFCKWVGPSRRHDVKRRRHKRLHAPATIRYLQGRGRRNPATSSFVRWRDRGNTPRARCSPLLNHLRETRRSRLLSRRLQLSSRVNNPPGYLQSWTPVEPIGCPCFAAASTAFCSLNETTHQSARIESAIAFRS